MYGLKKGIDLSFLNGRELMQIALGVRHISFRFDEDVSMSVKGEFSYFDGQAEWWNREQNPAQIANRTVYLVGATIQNFAAQEDGTLILTFSNGQRLTIPKSSKQYESSLAPARPSSSRS